MSWEQHRNGDCGPRCLICAYEAELDEREKTHCCDHCGAEGVPLEYNIIHAAWLCEDCE